MNSIAQLAFVAVIGAVAGVLGVLAFSGGDGPPPANPVTVTVIDYKIESAGSLVVENHKQIVNGVARARDVYEAAGSGWLCGSMANFDISQDVPVKIPALLNLTKVAVRAEVDQAAKVASFTIYALPPRLDADSFSVDYANVRVNAEPSVWDTFLSPGCPSKLVREASKSFIIDGIRQKLTTQKLAEIDMAVARRNAAKALQGLVVEVARGLGVATQKIAIEFVAEDRLDEMLRSPSRQTVQVSPTT